MESKEETTEEDLKESIKDDSKPVKGLPTDLSLDAIAADLPTIVIDKGETIEYSKLDSRTSLDSRPSLSSRPSMNIPVSESNLSLQDALKESKFNFSMLKDQLKAMGRITYEEIVILILFGFLILLWMTRAPILSYPGWGFLFGDKFVSDGTSAVFACFFLFLIPAKNVPPNIKGGKIKKRYYIMDWDAMKSFPWDIILLFGGGFALASGYVASGLTELIGNALQSLKYVPNFLLILLITTIITFLNQITSNTATAQIFLPIVASLCRAIKIHPNFLMIPTTLACSFSFALPISTPPNMIVFVTKKITVMQMFSLGTVMNIVGIILTTLFTYFSAPTLIGFDPDPNNFPW
jgi:sodium-dependent dicarboxylate transporter 2/3/5